MIFRNRPLARFGAAALLVSGALTVLGSPAYAAATETDFSIEAVVGTKVADGTRVKVAFAKISNKGTGTPSRLTVKADTSKVEHYGEVGIFPAVTGCTGEGETKPELWTCVIPEDQIPGPGETLELPIVMIKRAAETETAYTAPITLTIESPDDTDPSNNTAIAEVVLSTESGVDLGVAVPDVKTRLDPQAGEEPAPLRPGDTGVIFGEVVNQGDRTGMGVRLTLRLPEGTTFAGPVDACTYSSDERTAVCEDQSFIFMPDTYLFLHMPIVVDKGVKAPSTLPGGSLVAEPLGLPVEGALAKQSKRSAIGNAEVVGADDPRVNDLDSSDNSDDYAVIVADQGGSAGGNPGHGGNAAGGNAGGDGEDDGGLPVTGPQAGLIGGIGATVLAAGGVMFLVARRRRVVLVTPDDEKPAV